MNSKKQFGVWMDNHTATVVGKEQAQNETVSVIASVKGEKTSPNSSEKNANNHEKSLQAKFFKEISTHLQNATHVHVTGTGQVQEQFMHYLAGTPQFKNIRIEESTSNKMSDDKLVEFINSKLN